MEDTPVLKWTLAALGVIVACFCLGYFVLGPTPRSPQPEPAGVQVAQGNNLPTRVVAPAARPRSTGKPGIILEDQTAEIIANQEKVRKLEEENRKLAEALRQQKLMASPPPPIPSEELAETPAAEPITEGVTEELPADPPAGAAAPIGTPTPIPPDSGTVAAPEARAVPLKPIPAAPPAPKTVTATPKPTPVATPTPKPTPEPKAAAVAETRPNGPRFRVQVGSYNSKQAADNIAGELRGRGFSTSIVTEESGSKATFHVQVGAYNNRANASNTLRELEANGYEARIVE
ncbi:MAG: SPOR domain-containing protein [Capsulimonadales bacterium]|nr:SPOR domain-containing protein [Capsulimonadales bacterium]